jgi:hypothetical protein
MIIIQGMNIFARLLAGERAGGKEVDFVIEHASGLTVFLGATRLAANFGLPGPSLAGTDRPRELGDVTSLECSACRGVACSEAGNLAHRKTVHALDRQIPGGVSFALEALRSCTCSRSRRRPAPRWQRPTTLAVPDETDMGFA